MAIEQGGFRHKRASVAVYRAVRASRKILANENKSIDLGVVTRLR
jgi:hypothetical protein